MKSYFCDICKEDHAILEESDTAERIAHCDSNGHVGNCVTPPSKVEPWHWCAYCARKITKEEYDLARNKERKNHGQD